MFNQLREYFIAVIRTIVWSVALVALLFVAFFAVRLLGIAFDSVNSRLPSANDGAGLFIAAAAVVLVGLIKQIVGVIARRWRRKTPPSSSTTQTTWKTPPSPRP